jgi:hypothetical protein
MRITFRLLATFLVTVVALQSGAWAGNPTIKTLYTFTGQSDGGTPTGGLAFDLSGDLYGTASSGGASCSDGGNCGVAFKLILSQTGSWSEQVLYDFGSDGTYTNPDGSVILDRNGNLYSICNGQKEVFGLSPSQQGSEWTFETIEPDSERSPCQFQWRIGFLLQSPVAQVQGVRGISTN